MAHLFEQSFLIRDVGGSNPVIGKINIKYLLTTVLKIQKLKKNEARNGSF